MKMKKKAASAKKTAPKKKPAAKAPAPRKAVAKPEPRPAAPASESRTQSGTYTPSAVEGIGWKPFRYPPQ